MRVDRRTAMVRIGGAALGGVIPLVPDGWLRPGACGGSHVPDFSSRCYVDGHGGRHQLYITETSGPPVVLLHELPGLVTDDLDAAARLAARGYRVIAPLFFGDAGRKARTWTTLLNTLRVCGGNGFACGEAHQTSPHVAWLRGLVRTVRREWPEGSGVGVVGMCLTGAFPIALLQEPAVSAVVVCQPTLPFNAFTRFGWFTDTGALGVAPDDLARARDDSEAPILGIRYTDDWRCRPERFTRLHDEFAGRFYRMDLVGSGHSTLASDLCPLALDEVSGFFARFLRAESDGASRFPVHARNHAADEVRVEACHLAAASPHSGKGGSHAH